MSKIADLWILAAKKKTQVRTHASRISGYAGTPYYMRDMPAGLHIFFMKLDISDGFWRLIVQEADSYNFA
jgi:hypothetical protein